MNAPDQRRAACRELTQHFREKRPFSFLRLGDGELAFLLDVQKGCAQQPQELRPSVEIAHDGPGIDRRHYERLLASYEECDYLDYHDILPFNAEHIPQLRWQRRGAHRSPSPEAAMLIYDWTDHEFHDYVRGRRCLFAGAEAALLRELFAEPEYRALYARFWPADAEPCFHQVRGDGENLSEHLEAIEADLAALIQEQRIDTLFLCLGGAAKPICHELSRRFGICAIDFGSMMRGLAYCGSSGANLWRSSHHPFFVRIPFALHMRALERAHPGLPPVRLLAKAHAQLCLDLQRKQSGTSFTSDAIEPSSFDPSPENLRAFRTALACYRERYRPQANGDAAASALVKEFDRWCLKKGLGLEGKVFLGLVRARRLLRQLTGQTSP
jgi:hypothetical protein